MVESVNGDQVLQILSNFLYIIGVQIQCGALRLVTPVRHAQINCQLPDFELTQSSKVDCPF